MRLAALLAAAFATLPASADVFIHGQPGSHATIQAAVDAAVDGDTLLIEPGDYVTARIDGKGLHLHGLAGAPVRIRGTLEVRNLPAASIFTISDVQIDWDFQWGDPEVPANEVDALWLENCAGQVRVQRCTLEGSFHHQNGQNVARGAGLRVEGCPKVVVSQSSVQGGAAWPYLAGYAKQSGGDGLLSIDSAVALFDCTLVGGEGSQDTQPAGGVGGAGARVTGWGLLLSNTSVTGGSGGNGDFIGCTKSGDGGAGLVATASQVHLIEATLAGGAKGFWGSCGQGKVGEDTVLVSTTVNDLPPPARSLFGPRSTDDKQPLTFTVEGLPGDKVWILRSRVPVFQPTGGPIGIVLVPKPWLLPVAPMGVVPASGSLDVTLWTADYVGPAAGFVLYAQALVLGQNGGVRLSGPLHVLVRNT